MKRFKVIYFMLFLSVFIFTYHYFNFELLNFANLEENINAYELDEDIAVTLNAEELGFVEEESQETAAFSREMESQYLLKQIPPSIDVDLMYERYLSAGHEYFVVLSGEANIRSEPNSKSRIIGKVPKYTKLRLLKSYENGWLSVSWSSKGKKNQGYISNKLGEKRTFHFSKMESSIKKLLSNVTSNRMAYISNKKDYNGPAPLYAGNSVDAYGNIRYQSAPAYIEPNKSSSFRYFIDGTLVTVLAKVGDFYKVKSLLYDKPYYVPSKYVSFKNQLKKLQKVIVVDRKNQNQGAFEIRNGKITLISYTFATTGVNSKYKLETPLGYYMVMEKKAMFQYIKDGTKEIDGYAPYAIRFSAGAFIHGIPVSYKKVGEKLVDPGKREYLSTIGSTPRSHKCVRNYTSHAKFLYNWVDVGKSAVIVIE